MPALSAPSIPVDVPPEPNAIVNVHDAHAIKEGRYYYVYSTGPGVMIRRSTDLVNWTYLGKVFADGIPEWARKDIPGASRDFIWAPDIARVNGVFFLYYSVSTFGSNQSVIGLATNKTLDPKSKKYHWVDKGKVVGSVKSDDFNAIDPALVSIDSRHIGLSFGSYWSGIKAVDLDAKTGMPQPDAKRMPLAQRAFPDALEAPAIEKIGRYFYLFVSFDACCQGVKSTYNIRVGRALQWTGPYLDRDGKPLTEGGGTLVLGTEGRFIGPGHCSVLRDGSKRWLVYHFYDGENGGIATLQIRSLSLDTEGWPTLDAPLSVEKP